MGSVDKIFDDVPALDETDQDTPTVTFDGAWLADQLLAGLMPLRVAAAALRYQAREIALLRRSCGLEARS